MQTRTPARWRRPRTEKPTDQTKDRLARTSFYNTLACFHRDYAYAYTITCARVVVTGLEARGDGAVGPAGVRVVCCTHNVFGGEKTLSHILIRVCAHLFHKQRGVWGCGPVAGCIRPGLVEMICVFVIISLVMRYCPFILDLIFKNVYNKTSKQLYYFRSFLLRNVQSYQTENKSLVNCLLQIYKLITMYFTILDTRWSGKLRTTYILHLYR